MIEIQFVNNAYMLYTFPERWSENDLDYALKQGVETITDESVRLNQDYSAIPLLYPTVFDMSGSLTGDPSKEWLCKICWQIQRSYGISMGIIVPPQHCLSWHKHQQVCPQFTKVMVVKSAADVSKRLRLMGIRAAS